MKQLAVTRPGSLKTKDPDKRAIMEIVDVPEPRITSPTEVKIKVAYCAICASDPHVAENIFHREVPYGMGHEISGVIVELGSGVNTKNLKVGDRVAGNFLRACGRCYHCQNGHPEFCAHAIDEGTAPGYAEYVIWDESQVWKIPDDMTLRKACLMEPVSIAVRAVDRCGIQIGQRALVQGGGPIGQLCLQILKMRGATDLTMIEPREDRRGWAKKFGADHVIDPFHEDAVAACMDITGGMGYDVIIEVTGVSAVADLPLKVAALGGHILYLAMYDEKYQLPLFPADAFYDRNLTITGTKVAPFCFPRTAQMLPRMQMDEFSGVSFPLVDAVKAFDAYMSMENLKVIINCNADLANA